MICLKIRTFVVSATTSYWVKVNKKCCDLLENSYLCGISNNRRYLPGCKYHVVICLKIRTFVVSATTPLNGSLSAAVLWFAWKFVPLWYQQQRKYHLIEYQLRCDLLENSYLCGISNNTCAGRYARSTVVICLKIRTFVVSATTLMNTEQSPVSLWFAWKFVPLWYQQQQQMRGALIDLCCDLLENSYLCGISNNWSWIIYWLA